MQLYYVTTEIRNFSRKYQNMHLRPVNHSISACGMESIEHLIKEMSISVIIQKIRKEDLLLILHLNNSYCL